MIQLPSSCEEGQGELDGVYTRFKNKDDYASISSSSLGRRNDLVYKSSTYTAYSLSFSFVSLRFEMHSELHAI